MLEPTPITYTRRKDVLTAEPPHARIRVEMISDTAAAGTLMWDGDASINITVYRPHGRELVTEATEVLAAVYWSRARSALTSSTGAVYVLTAD